MDWLIWGINSKLPGDLVYKIVRFQLTKNDQTNYDHQFIGCHKLS